MFGEVSYTSTDPWSTYISNERDCHPMLLELSRTMAATSSLFDAVTFKLGKQDGHNRKPSRCTIIWPLCKDWELLFTASPGVTTKTSSNLPYRKKFSNWARVWLWHSRSNKVKLTKLHQTPFRPAVATAFVYVPLLAWDLNILAGALFSSLLLTSNSSPCVSCCELL